MRERGFSNVTTVVIAALLAVMVAPLFMGWMVVDVQTKGTEKHHIWVPLPLGLARVAMTFVPEDSQACRAPRELVAQRETIRVVLDSLASCGDATLVSVRSPEANVRIATECGRLRLDVDAKEAKVHCAFEVEKLRRLVDRWDGDEVTAKMALDAVAALGRGQLLTVSSDEADVSIRIW